MSTGLLRSYAVARAVGWVSFREILRDKALYNILMLALLLLAVGLLAAQLTFIRPERVVLDFGVSAINLSCSFMAILLGSHVLIKEIERRTIHVALSRPISHGQFVLGKYVGLALIVCLNWLLLSLSLILVLKAASLTADVPPTWAQLMRDFFGWTAALGIVLILFQSLLLGALAMFFSTLTTASLSVIFSLGIYLVGNNISTIRMLAVKTQVPAFKALFNGLSWSIPNLEYFTLGTKLTYDLPVSPLYLGAAGAYALGLVALFLVIAGQLVRRRESG